jgi:hypothetical protein
MIPLQSKEPSICKFALQQADLQKVETFLNEYKNANNRDRLSQNEDEDDDNKDDDEESDDDDDDDDDDEDNDDDDEH